VIGVALQIHADGKGAGAAQAASARAGAIGGRLVVGRLLGGARVHGPAAAKANNCQANQELGAEVLLGSHAGFIPRRG
jgi:hypothetical protein